MPNSVFDGLADIFVDTLGEPVIYTPIATGVPATIDAIWTETTIDVVMGSGAPTDAGVTTLSMRAEDGTPVEGDTVTRVADSKTMVITTPILPDGKGMIRCNLADYEAPDIPGEFSLNFSLPANSGLLAVLEF